MTKLRDEKVHNLYSNQYFNRLPKNHDYKHVATCSTHGGDKIVCKILIRKAETKTPFEGSSAKDEVLLKRVWGKNTLVSTRLRPHHDVAPFLLQ
jgi:hypothetical protein